MDESKFKSIVRLVSWYASMSTCGVAYKNWSGEFCKEEQQKIFYELVKNISDLNIVWDELTQLQASLLGFNKWDSEGNLYLIPLHIFQIMKQLEPDRVVRGIDGVLETMDVADCDVRYGVTAYGIELK